MFPMFAVTMEKAGIAECESNWRIDDVKERSARVARKTLHLKRSGAPTGKDRLRRFN